MEYLQICEATAMVELRELVHVTESALDVIYIDHMEGYEGFEEATKENSKSFFSKLKDILLNFITSIRAKTTSGNMDTTEMSEEQLNALKKVKVKVFDNKAYMDLYKKYSDTLVSSIKKLSGNISKNESSKDVINKLSDQLKKQLKPIMTQASKRKNFMITTTAYDASRSINTRKPADATIEYVKKTHESAIKEFEETAEKLMETYPEYKNLHKFIRNQATKFTSDTLKMLSSIYGYYEMEKKITGNTPIDNELSRRQMEQIQNQMNRQRQQLIHTQLQSNRHFQQQIHHQNMIHHHQNINHQMFH